MSKLKITAALVASLFIGVSAASAANINGGIHTDIDRWIGLTSPHIEIDNLTGINKVTFLVNVSGDSPGNMTYIVEDELSIPLVNNVDESVKDNLWLPRAIYYSAILFRQIANWMGSIRDGIKLIPAFSFGGAKVTESLLGPADESINIAMNYQITEELFNNGENLTMNLAVIGLLPGEINGLGEGLPIVDHKQITVEIEYVPILGP